MTPPKHTPLKFSYLWKNVENLTNKMNKWGFDVGEAEKYIELMSSRVKTQYDSLRNSKKMPNYSRIIFSDNMLEYCYKQLTNKQQIDDDLLKRIIENHKFLLSVCGNDITSHLTSRHKPGALSNIVLYYQQNLLCKQYIAFSSNCRKAINIIMSKNPSERTLLPSDAVLQYIVSYEQITKSSQIRSIVSN